MFSSDYI